MWMCGSLFALWLAYSAKMTAGAMAAVEVESWTRVLIGVPFVVVWLVVAAVLAGLAWGAAILAKRIPWVAYAYAVLVVVLLAILYWVAVVLPPNSLLAAPV
jgi:hypothetical protein